MTCTSIQILIADRPWHGVLRTALFDSISSRRKKSAWKKITPNENCEMERQDTYDRESADRPERRATLVAMELAKYNIDIAVLCETRFHASGSLNDLKYIFYWGGEENGERREAAVGFAMKRDIVTNLTVMIHQMSYKILTMRIHMTKDRNATIDSAYALTMGVMKKTRMHYTVNSRVHLATSPKPTSSCW